ncbi:MAG: Type 1 glutamine amidotransferase-like domain-containing protein [Defluviitaleaceae bacterium]|nr:Type 1 glutamine amidotransferase-like domain-containing protein [Defluviitaleaceae bacterium]
MKIHYYSGWFAEALPANYLKSLCNDITDRKSLVLVWGCWGGAELIDFVKESWLNPSRIVFDEYHLVDDEKTKEEGHRLIKEASVLLILGGDTKPQADFFAEYELAAPIKESNANVIMGFSAGAKNMASKWVAAKSPRYEADETTIYEGLKLNNFCYVPYFLLDMDELVKNDMLTLSQEIDIYATSPESFIRTNGDRVTAFGDVYLISNSKIEKIGN